MENDWCRGGIAVIGSAVHVAGNTRSSEELFQLLSECRDVAQRVPCSRFNSEVFGSTNPEDRRGKTDAPFGYFCEDISRFDTSPGLFGVSPSECKHVDPQQRQLLLLTADAIRNAGMSVADVFNSNTGVFIGNMNRDYMMLAADGSIINQYSSQGSASAIAANRISFTFNFRGVSIAVDSACSATGIGIHFAANDLLSGNVDMAVVGGFNLIMTPYNYIGLSQLQVLSKTGKTLAFDESADGYTRGEGGGIVLLKRFEDAVRDGNRILGVIATTATCSNGRSVGAMAAPSPQGQLDMFTRTFERASRRGIRPCDVQYIECHGTGTHRGDAVEVNACGEFLFKQTPPQNRPAAVYIGSVKASVGHLEASACIPGLVKVLKCLEHKKIPKQLHYYRPNKDVLVEFTDRLRVPTETVDWLPPPNGKPRVAVVNSYGYGGSIAQLLIVEYVHIIPIPRAPSNLPAVLVIWGHSKAAVQQRRKLHATGLMQCTKPTVQYCLGGSLISNNNGGYQCVVTGNSNQQLIERIENSAIVPVSHKPQTVALVFPGQGSQGDIPDDLFHISAYNETLRQVEDWMQRTTKPYSILGVTAYNNSWPLSMQGLFIFSHQIALAALLFQAVPQFNEVPPILLGHSLGEYAVAFLTKELTLFQCCDAIWGIGEALEPLRGTGFMAEVSITNEAALRNLDIGCINSPDKVVISGPNTAMSIAVSLGATKIPHVEFPFHSSVMDSRKDAVCSFLSKIDVPAERWWKNIRGCVLFAQALQTTIEQQPTIFLELGQQTALSPAVVRTIGVDSFCVTQHIVKALTTLRQQGYRINWRALYGAFPLLEESLVELPLHLEPHWFESIDSFRSRMGFPMSYKVPSSVSCVLDHFDSIPPSGRPEDTPALLLEATFDSSSFPLLADHIFNKASLVPGTFWIELFASTAHAILPPSLAPSIVRNVEFKAACFTPPNELTKIRVTATCRDEKSFDVIISCRPPASSEFSPCASSIIEFHPATDLTLIERMKDISKQKCWAQELESDLVLLKEEWYDMFKQVNFDFGPRFRLLDKQTVFTTRNNITSVLGDGTVKDRVRVDLSLNDEVTSDFAAWPYCIHPGILDAATQGMAVKRSDGRISSSLPWKVGEVIHFTEIHRETKLTAFLEVIHSSPDQEIAHCLVGTIRESSFEPCLLLRNFTCKVVEENSGQSESVLPPYFEMNFVQQEMPVKLVPSSDTDTLLVLPVFRNGVAHSELAMNVAARLQRSTVVHCKNAAVPQECIAKNHTATLVVAVFLPTVNQEFASSDPATATFELLQDLLALVQSVQEIQSSVSQMNFVLLTDMLCLSDDATSHVRGVHHALVGAFRAIVVEHGELSPRLVEYNSTTSVMKLCEEIKVGWSQPKLESHCILNGELRLVGVYEKIRGIGSQAPTASQLLTLTDGSWLIAGGCGAMGLLIAKYLASIGATKVFLCSRRGVGDRDRDALEALPLDVVEILRVDITDFVSLVETVKKLQPPVRHVMNLAMVLHDKYIRSVTSEDVLLVGSPKIAGTWNLHRLEAELSEPFQTFVTTSSTTALVGTPGQFVYGSANCFMDGLMSFRRAKGLQGTSVQLGPVAGIGVLAREEGAAAKMLLERSGWIPHPPDVLLSIFTDVFLRGAYLPSVICPLQIAPNYFLPDHKRWKSYERLLQYIVTEEKGITQATLDDALAVVKRILAQELRYSEDSIQSESSLNNLGVTSMIQNILALSIQENFSGVSIPQRFFLSPEVTPLTIAREIIDRLAKLHSADSEAAPVQVEKAVSLIWGSGKSSKDALQVISELHHQAGNSPSASEQITLKCVEAASLRLPFRTAVLGASATTEGAQVADIRVKDYRAIFMFPGQGTQFVGMAKPFYDTFSVFRSILDTLLSFISDRAYSAELQALLLDPSANAARLNETRFTQPALFLMEVALGRMLIEAGIIPRAVGGHSVGEIAAKTVVGELTLRDGVTLVVARAAEMSTKGHGKMAAVLLNEKALKTKLAEWGVKVYIGAVNGPQSTVVSGTAEEIDRFVALCKSSGDKVLPLPNAHAFHSPMMSEAKSGLLKVLQSMRLSSGTAPVTSNLTGEWSQGQDVSFYIDQIDHCVLWDQCCDNLADKLRDVDDKQTKLFCLEVGPGAILSNFMKKKLTTDDEFLIRQCCPQNDTLAGFMALLGEMWCNVPQFSPSHLFAAGTPWVADRRVTITGATTFLGVHCVEQFIKNTACQLILPLSGSSNAQKRLQVQEACDRYGVHSLDEEVASRVIFIDADEFDEDSTDVLHVTTSMNSLADYESVKETNVIRATKLAELCIASGATLHYVSTMGVLWGIEHGDETQLPPISTAWMNRHSGYTQSKIVMEHKLRVLAAKKGLQYCVYRVDMLGGSSTSGAVGPNSYYTSLLRTILRSKTCPSYMFGPTPRITVDEAAAQICTLSGATHRFPQTFHITTGQELFSMREFAVGFDTVPFESFRESIQTDTEQPFLSLIDIRGDRHSQTPAQHQKSIEALVTARHSGHDTNSTRLAATVRRWLETHE